MSPRLLLVFLLTLSGAIARADFTDVTVEAGLHYLQHVPPASQTCIVGNTFCDLDRQTGGAAVADIDGDSWPDLFVTRLDAPDLLFRNLGDGRFEDWSEASGLASFGLQSNGAAFGDIDNDGDADLLVTTVGGAGDPTNNRNYLFVNDGEGHFQEEATLRGVDVESGRPRLTFSATWGDYDRDGWIDLFVTEWLGSEHAKLLRNRGSEAPGHFEDATTSAGLDLEGVNGFSATFVDLDEDGWQDLAIAADFGTSRLFWNQGDGTFRDGTQKAGVATDENGMGQTFGDFDGDGDLDWFVTSIFDPDQICETANCAWGHTGNRLYRNEGQRRFTDATDAAGVRDGAWGWGASFFDFDNDRDLDLIMTNGFEVAHTEIEDAFNDDPLRFWENEGSGTMRSAASELGLEDERSGKALLTFDYDRDGDLDVFVVNNAGAPRLYRNDAERRNRWLRIRVAGRESNRDALGARVTLWQRPGALKQVREVGVGSHFLGQGDLELHFGLGRSGSHVYRVRVEFPRSGRVVESFRLRSNQTHEISEPEEACRIVFSGRGRGPSRRRASLCPP